MLQWTQGWTYPFELVFQISSDKFPEVGLLDHKAVPFLIFRGISILLSTVATPIFIPTNSSLGVPFLHILTSTCCLLIYWLLGSNEWILGGHKCSDSSILPWCTATLNCSAPFHSQTFLKKLFVTISTYSPQSVLGMLPSLPFTSVFTLPNLISHVSVLVGLCLWAAFNTVDHSLRLETLPYFGIEYHISFSSYHLFFLIFPFSPLPWSCLRSSLLDLPSLLDQ